MHTLLTTLSKMTVVVFVICLTGCGYAFQGGGSILPPDVRKIYVPTVENNSTELGIGDVVTEALREQFDSYGVVTVVDKQSEADAVLKVKIAELKRNTRTTQSRTDIALQSETTLKLVAELRRVTGPVLWRDAAIKVSKGFGTSANSVVTSSADFAGGSISSSDLSNLSAREISRGQEQEVINKLAEDAALLIYNASVAPDF